MKRDSGFTLVEVMVAAFLISLVLLGVAAMSLTAYSNVHRGSEQTTASTLGLQRIEWLRNAGYESTALAAGKTAETLGGAYTGYVRTTLVEANTPKTGVKRITVTTTTPSGHSVPIATLVSE